MIRMILSFVFIFFMAFPVYAQDCSAYDDCNEDCVRKGDKDEKFDVDACIEENCAEAKNSCQGDEE